MQGWACCAKPPDALLNGETSLEAVLAEVRFLELDRSALAWLAHELWQYADHDPPQEEEFAAINAATRSIPAELEQEAMRMIAAIYARKSSQQHASDKVIR